MRLYICAGLFESPLQQPSGPRDVRFCLTLLLQCVSSEGIDDSVH